jgi:hypothetical protein
LDGFEAFVRKQQVQEIHVLCTFMSLWMCVNMYECARVHWPCLNLFQDLQTHQLEYHTSAQVQLFWCICTHHLTTQALMRTPTLLQATYARRAAAASAAAHEHLTGLATFKEPTAGMFVWFKLCGTCMVVRLTVLCVPCGKGILGSVVDK